jgi:surface antigen
VPRVPRAVASLACLLLVSGLGVGVTAQPASATIDPLCTGYDACRLAGMPNGGYKPNSGTSWWNMIPGHNCTNYVAYRMVKSGMSTERPWPTGSGTGNAETWGVYKVGITNATPRVGAVAWWKANVPGAGEAGHVAYVERVVSPGQIVVSEDNWKGEFHWRSITLTGGRWPSDFIHFNDIRLQSTRLPTVSGTPKVGEVLTASTGTWAPVAARANATYRIQWRADGANILDATGPTFTVRPRQEGRRISVHVTATSLGYLRGIADSASTAPVEATTLKNTTPPTISGYPAVDSTLTASPGEWTMTPTGPGYQWLADGQPIEGATTATLTPGPELVGKGLSVTVTVSRDGYIDASATSAPTVPVVKGTFIRTGAPVVTGVPRLGETLQVDPGSFTPEDADVSVQWLRAGVPVEGATGPTYQLRRADLGSRVAARVRLTRPGYTPLAARSAGTQRVKSLPTLAVQTERGTGTLRAAVTVTATGVRPVPGTVRIRSTRLLAELTLRRGAAATTLSGLPQGLRTFTFRYTGTDKVAATTVSRTVRIG